MDKITTAELKKINQKKIYQLIYQAKRLEKQEIAKKLHMSLPTITKNLKELSEMHLIEKNGFFQSTGGRKAQAIICISNAKIAVGAEISVNGVRIVAVDLYGDILKQDNKELAYKNCDSYYLSFGNFVKEFIQSLHVAAKRIMGIGIAIQGLLSSDGKTVTYGEVLGCTGVSITDFSKHIPYECRMVHDAEAAAQAEMWFSKTISDAVYININNNIGGALILNGKLHQGKNLKSGLFEHMTIVPNGLPCYCGKNGCLEVYCSISSLLSRSGESLETFFEKLRAGQSVHQSRWASYLKHLALAIDNIHMAIDCDVILGGYLASYLTESDIALLHQIVSQNTAFPFENPFIRISCCKMSGTAQGAALPFINQFFGSLW